MSCSAAAKPNDQRKEADRRKGPAVVTHTEQKALTLHALLLESQYVFNFWGFNL